MGRNSGAGVPAGPALAPQPTAGRVLKVRAIVGAAARARSTEYASESVAERRVVEGVEERVDGRVGVAEPQSQLVEAVVNWRRNERFDNEHGEVRNPTDGESNYDRCHCHHRFSFTDYLRRLCSNTSNKLSVPLQLIYLDSPYKKVAQK